MKIPEDLRTWYSVACDKVHFATDYDAIRKLIERIAALTEQLEQRDQELAQARAENERLEQTEHVAWLCYKHNHGRRSTIHLCDSDTEGAFKWKRSGVRPSKKI